MFNLGGFCRLPLKPVHLESRDDALNLGFLLCVVGQLVVPGSLRFG